MLCACGCGGVTSIAKVTNTKWGHRRGEHVRYVHNHHLRKSGPRYLVTESGCWEWQLSRDKDGYGQTNVGRKRVGAHRFYYEERNGQIPKGLVLRHRCDNKPCVNPDHLVPGTVSQNTQEAYDRGFATFPRGEKNHQAKLTDEEARQVYDLATKSPLTQRKIADDYGIKQSTVSNIKTGLIRSTG